MANVLADNLSALHLSQRDDPTFVGHDNGFVNAIKFEATAGSRVFRNLIRLFADAFGASNGFGHRYVYDNRAMMYTSIFIESHTIVLQPTDLRRTREYLPDCEVRVIRSEDMGFIDLNDPKFFNVNAATRQEDHELQENVLLLVFYADQRLADSFHDVARGDYRNQSAIELFCALYKNVLVCLSVSKSRILIVRGLSREKLENIFFDKDGVQTRVIDQFAQVHGFHSGAGQMPALMVKFADGKYGYYSLDILLNLKCQKLPV
uniref:Uncharacterized protein n=1 Tax=Panagrolaimus sp. PS1159 TaxID=55785 RepID=A0AC35F427_9BILA